MHRMKAALLPDRGVVKVAGDGARNFLHGLVTADILKLTPGRRSSAPCSRRQGKIIADFIAAQAQPVQSGDSDSDFFLDMPRALGAMLVDRLNLYKLRAKVLIEDLSETLGVLAAWDGQDTMQACATKYGLSYADPRLPALGTRTIIPPHRAAAAAAELGAKLGDANDYETHRIALGVPRGGVDFAYGDAFPHEADMDQLGGVDFTKGCYVGQEVVSRIEHRGVARTRAVPVRFDGTAPEAGAAVMAGDRQLGTIGSAVGGRVVALLRLDRVDEAIAQGEILSAGTVPIRLVKPDWARFPFPGEPKKPIEKAAE